MSDVILVSLTIAMFGTVCLAVGYSYHVTILLTKREKQQSIRLVRRVGGTSDVCKDEEWMPFG